MVAAWCFLSVEEGWRSYRQHDVELSLKRLDALLVVQTWVSPPAWMIRVENFLCVYGQRLYRKKPLV